MEIVIGNEQLARVHVDVNELNVEVFLQLWPNAMDTGGSGAAGVHPTRVFLYFVRLPARFIRDNQKIGT